MAIMAMDTRLRSKPLLLFIPLTFLPVTGVAGDWLFRPNLIINETYTDNAALTVEDEHSSLVSEIGLSFNNSYRAKHLTATLDGKSRYVTYTANHDRDDDFHDAKANFQWLMWPSGISLIGSASIANQSQNDSRNILADVVSGDTVQTEKYDLGLNYSVNNSDFNIASAVNYNLSESQDNIGEQKGYNANLSTQNGSSAKIIFWQGQGNYIDTENDNQSRRQYQGEIKVGLITAFKFSPFIRYFDEDNSGTVATNQNLASTAIGAGFRWEPIPRLLIDVSYNKPKGNKIVIDGEEQEEFIDGSISWQPSSRTKLEGNITKRFYGDSYRLNIQHRNKRLTNSISYDENVQTFTRNNFTPITLGNYWCPQGENIRIEECYINNGESIDFEEYRLITLTDFELSEDYDFSLNKALNWSSNLSLPRTNIGLTLTHSDKENLTTRLTDIGKSGMLSVGRTLSGRSSINLSGSYNETTYEIDNLSDRRDRYRNYRLSYSKSLNSELNISVNISHINRSSEDSQLNYEENRVALLINKGF